MHRLCLKKAVRDLTASKARTILVLIAMIIGVTGAGSVLNARTILSREMKDNYMRTNPASATLWVEGLNDATVKKVEALKEVREAEERKTVTGSVRVKDGTSKEIVLFIVKDFDNLRISTFKAEKGEWPPKKGDILIERAAMQVIDAKIGNNLDIGLPGSTNTVLKLAGTVHAPALPPAWMEGVVFGFITFDTYKTLGGSGGLDELKFVVSENQMDKEYIRSVTLKVKDLLEQNGMKVSRVDIPEPGEHPHATQMETLLFLLESFAVIALILSAVLVANMISALLSGQIRQIGMMKAVGARRSQINLIYLCFVAVLGLVSVAAAVPLAVLAGRAYSAFAAGMLNFEIFSNKLPYWTFIVEISVGMLLPALASGYSILRGSRISVREALQDYGVTIKNRISKRRRASSPGIKFFSRPFLLSVRNTFRKKGRLLFTLGVLSIGGTLFITAMNVSASMNTSSEGVIKSFLFDASISLAKPYGTAGLKEAASMVEGIKSMEIWNGSEAAFIGKDGLSGDNFSVVAIPPESPLVASISPNEGSWLSSRDTNSIVLNQVALSFMPETKVGDTITLRINGKDSKWKVAGIVQEILSEAKAYVNLEYFQKLTGQEGLGRNVILVTQNKDPKNITGIVKNVESSLNSAGFETTVSTRIADIRGRVESHLMLLAVLLTMMSAMGVVVGGLGLSTTMGINVLERTREIGVMRAIGASTHAIFRIIVGEGTLIGILSWIIAVLIAAPVSVFVSYMFGSIFFGTPLKVAFSPAGAVIWLLLAIVSAAISCLYPARKASIMSVRETLSYE